MPWKAIRKGGSTFSEDLAFWWQATGPSLAVLLQEAAYDPQSQQNAISFYLNSIIPRLGPGPTANGLPTHWKSFVTDDFSPLEWSWSWDTENSPPKVRFTMEAIGPEAGSVDDPFNQAETMDLIRTLNRDGDEGKWKWFDHFTKAFVGHSGGDSIKSQHSQSCVLIAFDLPREQKADIVAKAYLIPVKAEQTGHSRLSILSEAIRSLESGELKFPAYYELEHFMSFDPDGSQLEVVGLGIDIAEPRKSRLRLYVRSPATSFDSVCAIMTMGGRLSKLGSGSTLANLREIWSLVLSLDKDFSSSDDLPRSRHETAGTFFNFDIKPGNAIPEAKLYIPAKHYGRDDLAVAEGLGTYLRGKGKGHYVDNYMRALEEVCKHRPLDSDHGLQTYIGCGIEREELSITSYIAPEIYHPARWSKSNGEG